MPEPTYEVITFDCYGTLIDWEEGIWKAFQQQASLAPEQRALLLETYHEVEAELELDEYRPYAEVLRESAARVGERLEIDTGDGRFLPASLPMWRPFADTNPALERLSRKGVALAILSNVDDDLVAETRKHFTVEFEFVVTAQQVRSYKPGDAHFERARERIRERRWLHAAQSYYHDIVPAARLGISSAWVNRTGESQTGEESALFAVTNLTELADRLGA